MDFSDLFIPFPRSKICEASVDTNCLPTAPPGREYNFPLSARATVHFQMFSQR